MKNLILEGFVVHFRNLYEFFYPPKKPRDDDVTAQDYIPSWGSPIPPQLLKDAKKRAHKELAHLTTKRKSGLNPDKHWDRTGLSVAMKPVIEDFIRSVGSTKIEINKETIDLLRSVSSPPLSLVAP